MTLDRELIGAALGITANLETLKHAPIVEGMTRKRALEAALLAFGGAFCRIGGLLGISETAALLAVKEAASAQAGVYN